MEIIEIQIINRKVIKLLRQLEELQLVRILKKHKKKEESLSDKFEGKLPLEVAEEAKEYFSRSREEWTRDI